MSGPDAAVITEPVAVPATVLALALAVTVDGVLGEPPGRVHPVALFGRLVAPFDREWGQPRTAGTILVVVLPLTFAASFGGIVAVATRLQPLAGVAVGGVLLSTTISLRMLRTTTQTVVELTETDLEQARERVRALVGRDVSDFSPAQLRSAATESLAENLADGYVASLLAFLLGCQVTLGVGGRVSLAVGVGCGAWVKGVNTLDSMLGYTTKPVGWASARLDDAVMWLPARVSALLIAVAAGDPRALVRARQWASAPSSPNSGWPMATLAATLDVSLVKPGAYALSAGPELPTVEDSTRGIRVVTRAGVVGVLAVGTVLWTGSGGVVGSALVEVVVWS